MAERSRAPARRRWRASDRARRQLLADVSHELMTPLTAMRGYTETLAMPELDARRADAGRYLGIIGEETQKLESLIGDLLDLARLEGGGGTLRFKMSRSRSCSAASPTGTGRRSAIGTSRLDVAIRAAAISTVCGDPQRLEQALQNLAANALAPHARRRAAGAARHDDGRTASRSPSRDTGPGIAPEHLPHIFDRFYKADRFAQCDAAATGSGLGLSIVQAIVERHGGTVTASNAPEGGAVFEITIPRRAHPTSD